MCETGDRRLRVSRLRPLGEERRRSKSGRLVRESSESRLETLVPLQPEPKPYLTF